MDEGLRLFKSCETGDIDTVKEIVAKGTDPGRVRCSPTWWGSNVTPLHAACGWVCSRDDIQYCWLRFTWNARGILRRSVHQAYCVRSPRKPTAMEAAVVKLVSRGLAWRKVNKRPIHARSRSRKYSRCSKWSEINSMLPPWPRQTVNPQKTMPCHSLALKKVVVCCSVYTLHLAPRKLQDMQICIWP